MNLDTQQLQSLCELAKAAALEAGQYIQSQFDQQYIKQSKEGGDSLASQVVTEVDIKAQEIILSHLNDTFSSHDIGLLTEESVDDQSRAIKDYFWCVDPMDGTLPFTERRTGYAVSIALVSNSGDPVIGVVYIPDLEQCYSSVKDDGVCLNNSEFSRNNLNEEGILQVYMDSSFLKERYHKFAIIELETLISNSLVKEIAYHSNFGGVRNAIGVMNSYRGCYFKFPKQKKGCGSIWDYAATRLFFEELGLIISNSKGERLNLNNHHTTFMNEDGILYSTDESLSEFLIQVCSKYSKGNV